MSIDNLKLFVVVYVFFHINTIKDKTFGEFQILEFSIDLSFVSIFITFNDLHL